MLKLDTELDVLLRRQLRPKVTSHPPSVLQPLIDLAARLLGQEVDDLKHGRFARAVQADQASEFGHVEVEVYERLEMLDMDRRDAHGVGRSPRRAVSPLSFTTHVLCYHRRNDGLPPR
jgi:hypothetical protein